MIEQLTPRQQDALESLCRTGNIKKAADLMFVSKETMMTHLTDMYQIFDVHGYGQLIAYAFNNGLVKPEADIC